MSNLTPEASAIFPPSDFIPRRHRSAGMGPDGHQMDAVGGHAWDCPHVSHKTPVEKEQACQHHE